jgi:acyl-CoA synthetase (AMP-forming)/AMP-acid ligase II
MIEAPTLWQLIEERARATPEARMAVDPSGREIDFATYREAALRTAGGLVDLGVGPGVTVSWMLTTRIESLILIGALSRLDAIQNPILPIYRTREVRFIATQCRPHLLILPNAAPTFDYPEMGREIAAELGELSTLVVDNALPGNDDAILPPPPPCLPADELAVRWLFYTSGTTADPKGAQHTDASLWPAAKGMCLGLQIDSDDRVAFVFPLTHIGGINWLQASLATGCSLILIENFAAPETMSILRQTEMTLATAGTVFHEAYLKAHRESAEKPLFPSVRAMTGGGAPKPPQLHYDVRREMGGAGIISGYGLTECPIITMASIGDPDDKLAETEGRRSLPEVEIRVVRADEMIADDDEEGEIRARGPQLFRGYLDATLDAAAFDSEGYLRTGDLGRIDADGFLTITGRLKDVIIRKGENIPAKEIEDLLYLHRKVADVAAIGLPDPASGERCCAIVVCKNPDDPLEFGEMQAFLRDQGLMIQKIPEQLEILTEIPRNPTGKILKHELRARYAD